MDCADIEMSLLDFHFAVGSQEERDAVREHLRACQGCAQRYLDLKHDIDSGAAMDARPSDPARQRLRDEVTALYPPSLFGATRRFLAQPTPRYRAGLAMAALCAIVLFVGLRVGGQAGSRPSRPATERAVDGELQPVGLSDDAPTQRPPRRHGPRHAPELLEAHMLPRGAVDSARPQAISITYY